MFKKILLLSLGYLSIITTDVFAVAPSIGGAGLPGSTDTSLGTVGSPNISQNVGLELVTNIISQVIQYTAVVAVIALIISGMMLLISAGDDEKAKRAKSWVTWSLVGVILSVSAWGIINMLNNFTIG